jgi:hypothetical protein
MEYTQSILSIKFFITSLVLFEQVILMEHHQTLEEILSIQPCVCH